jgi:hypothetical protein
VEEVKNLQSEVYRKRYHEEPEQSLLRYISTGDELLKSDSGPKWKMSWPEYMWQQELLEGIIDYQKLLKKASNKIGDNSKVIEAYKEALESVEQARSDIHNFAAVFNKEYSPKD